MNIQWKLHVLIKGPKHSSISFTLVLLRNHENYKSWIMPECWYKNNWPKYKVLSLMTLRRLKYNIVIQRMKDSLIKILKKI